MKALMIGLTPSTAFMKMRKNRGDAAQRAQPPMSDFPFGAFSLQVVGREEEPEHNDKPVPSKLN